MLTPMRVASDRCAPPPVVRRPRVDEDRTPRHLRRRDGVAVFEAEPGGLALVRATVTDPGRFDVLSASIDWGDGTVTVAPVAFDGKVVASHEYGVEGSYSIVVTATDGDGGSASEVVGIEVTPANRGPEVALGSDATVPQGTMFQRTVTLSDPGGSGITSAFVDWGDGTPGQELEVGADATVQLAHQYIRRGSWTLQVIAVDDEDADGADGADAMLVDVTDVAPQIGAVSATRPGR